MPSRVSRRRFLAGGSALAASVLAATSRPEALAGPPGDDAALDRFLDDVKRAGAGRDPQAAVHAVLERAVADPGALLRAVGAPQKAGIHPLHRSADLTILNVVWAPMMVLLPHDHRMWATIGLYTGREDNILWTSTHGRVSAVGARSLTERAVLDLPRDAIHSVVNPIGRLTGAIHVYGGDFFGTPRSEWDAETLRERPWDLEAARRTFDEASRRFRCATPP